LEEEQTGGMDRLICNHLPHLPFGNLLGFIAAPGSVFRINNDYHVLFWFLG
jgi:hypothetical protein